MQGGYPYPANPTGYPQTFVRNIHSSGSYHQDPYQSANWQRSSYNGGYSSGSSSGYNNYNNSGYPPPQNVGSGIGSPPPPPLMAQQQQQQPYPLQYPQQQQQYPQQYPQQQYPQPGGFGYPPQPLVSPALPSPFPPAVGSPLAVGVNTAGFFAQYYNALTPQETQELTAFFHAVDTNRSGTVTAPELQRALSNAGHQFRMSTAAVMIKLFDKTGTGAVSFNDFAAMHKFIMGLHQSFKMFDYNRNNTISGTELHHALAHARLNLSPQTVAQLEASWKDPTTNQPCVGFPLPQFIELSVFLCLCRSMFDLHDAYRQGTIQVPWDQFVTFATAFRNS